jgi:hypothetical protein
MIEKRVRRKILGRKKEKVAGVWRKVLKRACSWFVPRATLDYQIKMVLLTECVARMGKNRNVYVVLDGKPEGKRQREGLLIDTRLMLKLILKYFVGEYGAG